MILSNIYQDFPSTIGVYIFKAKTGEILYIGKSVNIKARIKSHFENAKLDAKERAIIEGSQRIETIATESEFKALILESSLIQKFRPKYNKIWMDDKSYLYVRITTSEEYPKISLIRKSDIEQENVLRITNYVLRKEKDLFFGPFSSRKTLESLLREIRRVIPFCTAKKITKSPCFYSKIGLCNPCPNYIQSLSVGDDPCVVPKVVNGRDRSLQKKVGQTRGFVPTKNAIYELQKEYKNNIKEIIKIFNGKVEIVLKDLRRELGKLSKEEKYEEALLMRNRIERFERLISERNFDDNNFFSTTDYKLSTTDLSRLLLPYFQSTGSLHRIECYDVSNLNFKEATAAMTVAENGSIDKSQYRKFKIRNEKNIFVETRHGASRDENRNRIQGVGGENQAGVGETHDRASLQGNFKNVDWELMRSVFLRRFKHDEWEFPNLLVVDGGKPQVRMAVECMKELNLQIPAIGIAKNPDRLVIGIEGLPTIRPELNNSGFNLIRLLRDEAHRFGRKYHLILRDKRYNII